LYGIKSGSGYNPKQKAEEQQDGCVSEFGRQHDTLAWKMDDFFDHITLTS
jgi:hypothetical protein